MATNDPIWSSDRFRAIDDSHATLVRQLLRAVIAMAIAFSVSWRLATVLGLQRTSQDFLVQGLIFVVCGCISIFLISARPIRAAIIDQRRAIAEREAALEQEAERHGFANELHQALEMAQDETDALAVVGRAVALIGDQPTELLLADHSRAHLRRAVVSNRAEPPGCGVESPMACPAVVRGQTLEFRSSEEIGACPRLAERSGEPRSAVCVPVTVLGRPTAVLHATAPVGAPIAARTTDALETIATQAGSRVGVLRAMARTERQAATDPLTGQLNRRSLEDAVRRLREADSPFALAIGDIDHFKILNDTYGHETGDKALRLFARTLAESVREDDVVCRYGGEEFVIVFPGCSVVEAAAIVHRARDALRKAVATGDVPSFTVSYGLADSKFATDFDEVLRTADAAMFRAKEAGRDRLVIADEDLIGSPQIATDLPVPEAS